MTPPSTPQRPQSPIIEWPPHPSVLHHYTRLPKPLVERVRDALEKCGIINEHAVNAVMEAIDDRNNP